MFYELQTTKEKPLHWPAADDGVKAKRLTGMRGGEIIRIPVQDFNQLITGTSGYGKTVFTKKSVHALINRNPQRYIVFFQIKPDDFTEEFLRPQDKVISYSSDVQGNISRNNTISPFPWNVFRWNMIKEIRSCVRSEWESILDEISMILFSDIMQDSRNRIWADGARNTFKAYVRVILYKYSNNPSNFKLIGAMKAMNRIEFLKFLAQYKPNRSMLKDNFDFDADHCEKYVMPKRGMDIFFFLQNVLDKFGGTFLSEDGDDTIYDYMHGRYGERLFILHDHKKRNSSKLFERFFLKYMCDEMLSRSSDFDGQMLWVLDEIDKIEYDFGLTQAVTLGRQFHLQVIVSTQSLESLYAIAPEMQGEHLTNAALAGFPMTVTFHPGDPHTIETMQTLYGKCMKQTVSMPLSRYDKPTVMTQMQPIVEDSDFASLDVGECYVKIRSEKPVRVKIIN